MGKAKATLAATELQDLYDLRATYPMLGGFLGILLGVSASLILGATTGWTVVVSPDSVGLSVAFSASIGIVFGL